MECQRNTFWNGYKVHVTETCGTCTAGAGERGEDHAGADSDGEALAPPHLIVNVETTDATVPDSQMTAPIHARLAGRHLLPDEHLVDSGYPSAELLVSSLATFGITLVTPMLADTSAQARAGAGSTAPPSPSTSMPGRPPARKATPPDPGTPSPSAAPARS